MTNDNILYDLQELHLSVVIYLNMSIILLLKYGRNVYFSFENFISKIGYRKKYRYCF